MKTYFKAALIGALLLVGCSDESEEKSLIEKEQVDQSTIKHAKADTESKNQDDVEIDKGENNAANEEGNSDIEEQTSEPTVDTSIYENAKNVEVTDSRNLNKHLTLKIDLQDGADPGMGTLNVLTNTFDFLHQADIAGATTITILVRVKDVKVSQFKVYTEKFKPNEEDPMANLVLAASDIEHLHPEVKSFGEAMGLW